MKSNLWPCDLCGKPTDDNKDCFRFFACYDVLTMMGTLEGERLPFGSSVKKQIRICKKCLKTDLKEINI